LVVDAGRAPSGAWAQSVPGPSGVELITAASDTATESGALSSYLLFQTTMNSWKDALTKWRCHLSEAERRRYGAGPNWNCNDVRFFIGRIAFGELGPERAAALDHVETTLRLPRDQVDMLIAAGHDAVQANSAFQGFLQLPPAKPVQRSPAVAASVAHSRQAIGPETDGAGSGMRPTAASLH
jgi:NTE family protein